MTRPLRVAFIGSARFPIHQPFAGGLEAHTWAMVRGLQRRGHAVTVFGGADCDPDLNVEQIIAARPQISDAARADVSMSEDEWLEEHHAYLGLMLDLAASDDFDIVHNNCLHHLPIAMARMIPVPMVCTLHTPPTPWLESAVQVGPCPVTFAAVSAHTARAWRSQIPSIRVIANGVDPDVWQRGPGGGPLLWSGRLVPEKGADLAIRAARLVGLPLDIVGPVSDNDYFSTCIAPLLGGDVRYLGHLDHTDLARLTGAASVSVVTPRWDEPYCLVAAEALSCGTPVCGFARGALPELLDGQSAVLVEPDDVDALAAALLHATRLSRDAARTHALAHCSQDLMIDRYESLYAELVA